jgi:hypothetical protein
MEEYEEFYVGENKTWDEWLLANPNLANFDFDDLLVFVPIKPYTFGWIEIPLPEEEPF